MRKLPELVLSLVAVAAFSHANAGASTITVYSGDATAGAPLLDAVVPDMSASDMELDGNYSSSGLLNSSILAAGNYTLSPQGLESCCAGFQQARSRAGDSSLARRNSTGAQASVSPVPEPSLSAMLLIGLSLLAFTGPRSTQVVKIQA